MASLVKIPYGELAPLPNSVPAFLTVNVDGVYKVIIDGTDGILSLIHISEPTRPY